MSNALDWHPADVATTTLEQFLLKWDKDYKSRVKTISLFEPAKTSRWSLAQKQYFARAFYHARGHFYNFLWFMGNHAPNFEAKAMILHNMEEEFGGKKQSHEQLYIAFAKSLGVDDIIEELLTQKTHLPFIKGFNQGHLAWLIQHDWDSCLAAFSAYERLDNIDYINLELLVQSLQVNSKDALFFKVHTYVEHFDTTLSSLKKVWEYSPNKIRSAFNFIALHQQNMWEQLSDAIFSYQ